MASDVFLEDIISGNCSGADVADVGWAFGVRESVSSEVFFSNEALSTAFMGTVVPAVRTCALPVHLFRLLFEYKDEFVLVGSRDVFH